MNFQHRIQQGMALHKAGHLDQAEPLYEAALREQPGAYPALHLMGLLRQQQGRLPEALALMERALTVQPGAPDTLINYGMALKDAERYDEALAILERAVAARPASEGAWNNQGIVLLRLKRHAEALSSLDRALALNPKNPGTHYNRGLVLKGLERVDEAKLAFEAALALAPNHADAEEQRGYLSLEADPASALTRFDRALALKPSARAHNNRGKALMNCRRYDDAVAAFDAALGLEADFGDAIVLRGRCLCLMNRTEEGFADFRRAGAFPKSGKDVEHKRKHDAEQRAYLNHAAAAAGDRLPGSAVNPGNDVASIQRHWKESQPQMVVIDNLLTPQALEALHRYCMAAKVWELVFDGGYLGAMPRHGFAPPLLAQIADEMRQFYPALFGNHALNYHWAFKYDSSLCGINVHADEAAVNVNFWITPDSANLDPDHGGLVVWDKAAPREWDFNRMNGNLSATREFLAQSGAKPVTIPYRANRAVIFDSDLFHETDVIRFKDGYENRRINITLLYGRRQDT